MRPEPSIRDTARHRVTLRAALVGLLAVLSWTLAGCGDPDDDDGGGGYVAQQPVAALHR